MLNLIFYFGGLKVNNEKCIISPFSKTISDDELYDFFVNNIWYGNLYFDGYLIRIFESPVVDGKVQGYFHLTTRVEKRFNMKLRLNEDRRYYINHVKFMIENYKKCENCIVDDCLKIKHWTIQYKDRKRIKLLYCTESYSYLIVLEKKKNEIYIVTSFLIDDKHYLSKILKEYEKCKL